MSHGLSHDLSIHTPVLKGPRVCNTTKQGAPPIKRHHENQWALQTGQGQSCEEVQIRVGLLKNIRNFEHPTEPNPDLYFSTTLSLTCLESSLFFIVTLAWWCLLLSVVADSGAFQNRCKYTEIMWQTMWNLRLHTGGHYLTNYVTSEGNWLHQMLFRGFIAKKGNTFLFVFFLNIFLEQVIFFNLNDWL